MIQNERNWGSHAIKGGSRVTSTNFPIVSSARESVKMEIENNLSICEWPGHIQLSTSIKWRLLFVCSWHSLRQFLNGARKRFVFPLLWSHSSSRMTRGMIERWEKTAKASICPSKLTSYGVKNFHEIHTYWELCKLMSFLWK